MTGAGERFVRSLDETENMHLFFTLFVFRKINIGET